MDYPVFRDLIGKKAIVTAATAGIGRETARALVAQGCNVAILSRNAEKLTAFAAELQQEAAHGAIVYTVQVDLTKLEDTRTKTKEALVLLGGVDIVFNNGPGYSQPSMEAFMSGNVDLAQIEMYKVNCVGIFAVFDTCLEALKASTAASVINMSSILGHTTAPGLYPTAYNAAKMAVLSITRDQALLHAKDGIRVNSVSPGYVVTDIFASAAAVTGMSVEDYRQWRDDTIPMGACGEPSDVASAVLFLASNASKWITGQDIRMDGGVTLTCNTALAPGAIAQM